MKNRNKKVKELFKKSNIAFFPQIYLETKFCYTYMVQL